MPAMRVYCQLHSWWTDLSAADITIDPQALTASMPCRWDTEPHLLSHSVCARTIPLLLMQGAQLAPPPDPELFDPIRHCTRGLTEDAVDDWAVELIRIGDVAGAAIRQQGQVDNLRRKVRRGRVGGGW
jgi:hypothetical protein